MKRKRFNARQRMALGFAAMALVATPVWAEGEGGRLFGGDFSWNGLLRLEMAISTSDEASPANQYGLGSNGRPIRREAGNPLTGYTTTIDMDSDLLYNQLLDGLGVSGLSALPPTRGVSGQSLTGASDTITRYLPRKDPDLNYHLLRFEATPTLSWDSGWSFVSRFRAVMDPGGMGYADYDQNDFEDINGGFETARSGPARRQFGGSPDYLGYEVDNKRNPLLFERSGKEYQIDAPALFVQWTNGNVTARLGNQSVAWGQLLFFRLMDVANGLDLRRHLFIDRAIEEFADERMAAPGLRLTWQATDAIVIDSFALQFIPTVLPNANTPYNIVDSRFILHDNYFDSEANKKWNAGFRVKGEFGQYNGQFMFTSRMNPLGAIRWRKSGINKALPNSNTLGLAFNQACTSALIPAYNLANPDDQLALDNGCGPLLSNTAFEVAPSGLMSAEDWFDRASYTKLSATQALNRAVDQFPAAEGLLAQNIGDNAVAANNQLDAFFIAAEGLHGHIERNYHREEVVGIGGGTVLEAEPGSLLDQLIINLEATYAFDRAFTAVDLRKEYDERDEVQVGLVMEKYQRFSQSTPATYMVFQYLWQKESDLAGLLLDGYGSENFSDQGVKLTSGVPTGPDPKITPGVDGAHYVVLAALQPTNAYIFEYSVAALIDVQGGALLQPAVQWKPRGNITVNLFYNFIDSELWGGNRNKNLMSFVDFADELCLRLGYQF